MTVKTDELVALRIIHVHGHLYISIPEILVETLSEDTFIDIPGVQHLFITLTYVL